MDEWPAYPAFGGMRRQATELGALTDLGCYAGGSLPAQARLIVSDTASGTKAFDSTFCR